MKTQSDLLGDQESAAEMTAPRTPCGVTTWMANIEMKPSFANIEVPDYTFNIPAVDTEMSRAIDRLNEMESKAKEVNHIASCIGNGAAKRSLIGESLVCPFRY